jgi:hypothetical protein
MREKECAAGANAFGSGREVQAEIGMEISEEMRTKDSRRLLATVRQGFAERKSRRIHT